QARTGSDPTTSTVPKILAAGAALLIFGGWMVALMSDFWLDLWQSLPEIIK
ncbi:MAG: flagellar biosynthetic protein FliQ, partial [Armatimonadetes bacterium]|nr:flagellar biosynthetic protein FliQ [Armatimonadota bacterium]